MSAAVVSSSEPAPGSQRAASVLATVEAPWSQAAHVLCERVTLAWAIVLARVAPSSDLAFLRVDPRTERDPLGPSSAAPRSWRVALAEDDTLGEAFAKLAAAAHAPDPEAASSSLLELGHADSAGVFPGYTHASSLVLDLQADHAPARPTLHLHRSETFYDASTCEALLASVACVLAQLDDPTRLLRDLSLVSEAGRRYQLRDWNDTFRPFPGELRIEAGFEAQAARHPQHIAVEDAHEALTFAELDARANRIASALVARGVAPGERVAVLTERGAGLVAALLGVCKSGAAYVPLDPRYPDARLQFMWQDAGCRQLVTDRALVARSASFAPAAAQLIVEEVWQKGPAQPPVHRATADDLAYVIYTSGSTGVPNGVAMRHGPLLNTFDWVNRSYQVAHGDRLLFVTSPCFDLSVYDVFGVLAAGATVVVASDAELADPRLLAGQLASRRITLWDSAPAAFQLVLTASDAELRGLGLRLVMLSGDWVPLAMAKRIRSALPRARLEVLGGATEAAIWSNAFSVHELDPAWRSIPYGRPIQNAQYYVLDARLRLLPRGVPGRLFIGGVCLADGYVGRPELTAERFVPSPFASEQALAAGARLYCTGDLARFLPDGNLEFLGRSDHQLKVRGHRIELAEVENALAQLPEVRAAVVAPFSSALGSVELCAYLVLEAGAARSEAELRRALAVTLPGHMVPARVVKLAALPLSSNGKVDRKALPPVPAQGTDGGAAPRGATELLLHGVWSQLLGRSDFGRDHGFFDLGGQSLSAAVLLRTLELEHGLVIDLAAFLAAPTIAGMATALAPQPKLQPLSAALGFRPGRDASSAWLVVGGGPFVLLQHKLAELLPAARPVYFVRSERLHKWRRTRAAARCTAELVRAGLPAELRVIALRGAEESTGPLIDALRARGVRVACLVSIDADDLRALGPAHTLRVRGNASPHERHFPGELSYRGAHLAFLADGARSPVLAAIASFTGSATDGAEAAR